MLMDFLFGCVHSNTSRVFTLRNWFGKKETYIVCLDCAKKFEYDWDAMEEREWSDRDTAREHYNSIFGRG